MIYLSTSRALAALELLVHLTTTSSRSIPRALVTVEVPTQIIGGELWKDQGWRDNPPGKGSTDQGDDWLAVGNTAGVLVPSAIIPEEQNLLLNPLHPEFQKVTIVATTPFHYDSRLSEMKS